MNIPTDWTGVAVLIALLVPGLSFATTRVFFVGWRSPDYGPGARILDALFASAVFIVLYGAIAVLLAGGTLSQLESRGLDIWGTWPTVWIAALAITLLVIVPALSAWLLSAKWRRFSIVKEGKSRTIIRQVNRSRPVPRAWDFAAFEAVTPRFIRIRLESGEYYGGWYGPSSYISTYPHPRDIFVEAQWRMGADGSFVEPIADSLGFWAPLTDGCVVEWLAEEDVS